MKLNLSLYQNGAELLGVTGNLNILLRVVVLATVLSGCTQNAFEFTEAARRQRIQSTRILASSIPPSNDRNGSTGVGTGEIEVEGSPESSGVPGPVSSGTPSPTPPPPMCGPGVMTSGGTPRIVSCNVKDAADKWLMEISGNWRLWDAQGSCPGSRTKCFYLDYGSFPGLVKTAITGGERRVNNDGWAGFCPRITTFSQYPKEPLNCDNTEEIETEEAPIINYVCRSLADESLLNSQTVRAEIFEIEELEDQSKGVTFTGKLGAKVCSLKIDLRHQLLGKELRINDLCPTQLQGTYALRLVSQRGRSLVDFAQDHSNTIKQVFSEQGGLLLVDIRVASGEMKMRFQSVGKPTIYIVLDANPLTHKASYDLPLLSDGSDCDYMDASPLVIQIFPEGASEVPLRFTSVKDGINFDLFGTLSKPVAYEKKKIAWLHPQSRPDYYFVTLPNSTGEILGIDQLFGNSTLGPDGKTSSDGFMSLAKYDGFSFRGVTSVRKADGLIDHRDPVFRHLRLWRDLNGDGVAQVNEVSTFQQKGITSIDLKADRSFRETDIYGNQILYKSTAQSRTGKLHIVFDLWFMSQN